MELSGLQMNMSFQPGTVFSFADSVDYSKDAVVSKTIVKKETATLTLFSFDKGQGLSEHSAPFDALVQVVDGVAEVIINKKPIVVKAGESIIMPANVPHALNAIERFKMVLTMIRGK